MEDENEVPPTQDDSKSSEIEVEESKKAEITVESTPPIESSEKEPENKQEPSKKKEHDGEVDQEENDKFSEHPAPEIALHLAMFGTNNIQSFLIKGKNNKYVLIDALLPYKAPREEVMKLVEGKDISYIIITHAHIDHYGNVNAVMEKQEKCTVIAHQFGVECMTKGVNSEMVGTTFGLKFVIGLAGWFVGTNKASSVPLESCVGFTETKTLPQNIIDDLLDNFGGMKLFFTPGHTSDHISVYQEETGDMYIGDLIKQKNGGLVYHKLIWSLEKMQSSFKKVVEMNPKRIYATHIPFTFTAEDIKKNFTDVFGQQDEPKNENK